MGRIVHIDLTKREIFEEKNALNHYGRGLISNIINEKLTSIEDRLAKENILVLAPGLFSGTLAPSTGRLLVGTKESRNGGIFISNLAGNISQKLASLDVDAIILSGENPDKVPVTLVFNENDISLKYIENIKGLDVSPTIEAIKAMFGKDCGIIGIGPSGESILPLSTLFSTYPEGTPSFYCARNSLGDVFGAKNIKAVVVSNKSHFNAPVYDREKFRLASKELSRIIIDHPICGKALPGLGSITLLKLMQEESCLEIEELNIKKSNNFTSNHKINRNCSPLCVVGCLNKHASSGEECYSAPAESEAAAALFEAFNIDDKKYVKDFTSKCFELGIDCMEFIFSCEMYFKMEDIKGNIERLDEAIDEVRKMTLVGRVLASKTDGIYKLYKEKSDSKKMVSLPSIVEEKNFNIHIPSKRVNIQGLSDLEYLYAYVILLENLGFCLFTSFAFLESDRALSLLADMYYYKTGYKTDEKRLLQYAIESSNNEKNIPNFIKVLYRYFNRAS